MAFVYILRCADGSYYVGSTLQLDKRLWEHNAGLGSAYTRRPGRRPVELAWSYECAHIREAFTSRSRSRAGRVPSGKR